VVNRLIHLALAGETLPVYGDGHQRRDYIYINDVSAALARLGESSASDGRVFNVGTGIGTRFVDMAQTIAALAGGGRVEFVPWPPLAEQIETGDFVADISRIRDELGWCPAIALEDGVGRTIESLKSRVAS
jgi:nucleoside-diphosphate-sugar epimerase